MTITKHAVVSTAGKVGKGSQQKKWFEQARREIQFAVGSSK